MTTKANKNKVAKTRDFELTITVKLLEPNKLYMHDEIGTITQGNGKNKKVIAGIDMEMMNRAMIVRMLELENPDGGSFGARYFIEPLKIAQMIVERVTEDMEAKPAKKKSK